MENTPRTVASIVDQIKAEMAKEGLHPISVDIEDEDPNYVGVIINTDDHFYDDEDNLYEHDVDIACEKIEKIINGIDLKNVYDEYEDSKIDYALKGDVTYDYDNYHFVLAAEN